MSRSSTQSTLPTQERTATEPTPDVDPHHIVDVNDLTVPVDPADCTDCQVLGGLPCFEHWRLITRSDRRA